MSSDAGCMAVLSVALGVMFVSIVIGLTGIDPVRATIGLIVIVAAVVFLLRRGDERR